MKYIWLLAFSLLASERQVALLIFPSHRGEASLAHRMKIAGERIGWKVDVFDIQRFRRWGFRRHDFVINFAPDRYVRPSCKNYLAIFHPKHHFFQEDGRLLSEYADYDGYLMGYPVEEWGKPWMEWVPSVQWREYKRVEPKWIYYVCANWGNRLLDPEFQKMLHLLDEDGSARFYGVPHFKDIYPNSYQFEMPFDGESPQRIAAECGISLVIHSDDHNACGIPSGRIFEAASASTVIISDLNSFVQRYFGDSVLYIDGNDMYGQIRKHYEWIREHREEALEMAKRAYEICMANFTLEQQMLNIGEFHDRNR